MHTREKKRTADTQSSKHNHHLYGEGREIRIYSTRAVPPMHHHRFCLRQLVCALVYNVYIYVYIYSVCILIGRGRIASLRDGRMTNDHRASNRRAVELLSVTRRALLPLYILAHGRWLFTFLSLRVCLYIYIYIRSKDVYTGSTAVADRSVACGRRLFFLIYHWTALLCEWDDEEEERARFPFALSWCWERKFVCLDVSVVRYNALIHICEIVVIKNFTQI